MKYGKKYMFVACAALLLGMQSCDLEEYNPAGSTPDNVYKEQAGFEALKVIKDMAGLDRVVQAKRP